MAPIITLIIGKLLDYLADNADEIIQKIKDQFLSAKDPEVAAAIQEFGYEPNEESLTKLNDCLAAKGEDVGQLAKILINSATV